MLRRRLLSLLSILLLAVLMVAAPAAASDTADAAQTVVLAVDDDVTGPDPAPRNVEDNPARELGGFDDREIPFTWAAAWLLTAAFLAALVAGGLFYEYRVRRPAREAAGRR